MEERERNIRTLSSNPSLPPFHNTNLFLKGDLFPEQGPILSGSVLIQHLMSGFQFFPNLLTALALLLFLLFLPTGTTPQSLTGASSGSTHAGLPAGLHGGHARSCLLHVAFEVTNQIFALQTVKVGGVNT